MNKIISFSGSTILKSGPKIIPVIIKASIEESFNNLKTKTRIKANANNTVNCRRIGYSLTFFIESVLFKKLNKKYN
jgi:hypothetical protein